MTRMTIPQALLDYEQRLRALGAPVLDRLRPGLSEADLDALEVEFDFPLPPTARALWAWHDGAEVTAHKPHNTSLVPGGLFHDLRTTHERTQQWREITGAADPVLAPDLIWQPRWLMAIDDQYPVVLDCTRTPSHKTPVLRFTADDGVMDAFQLRFETWVETWSWAIDHQVWTLDDGSWVVHRDRRPPGPLSLVLM